LVIARALEEALERIAQLEVENALKDERIAELQGQVRSTQTLKARSPAHWSFHVLRWELGEQTFYPKDHPEGKTGPNLRVYIPLSDQSEGAPYWDITRKRIIDRLLPLLPMIRDTGATVEITQVGDGRTSDQVITIRPP
jgi:uncharacterized coiled-coil protein SlyX